MGKMFPDQFRLDGKLALITGASRGIGTAIAQIYAEAGADIASVSRTENVELGSRIKALGRRYQHFTADLSLREEVVKVVPEVAKAMGYPDILVNNAGSLRRGKGAINFKLVDWDWSLQLDLTTPYMLMMDCARHWLDNKKKGKIINIATILALSGGIDTIGYTAAKHGLAGLTKTLANDWSRMGINVNAVAPGYVRTDLTYGLWGDAKRKEMLLERVPSKKWGEPEDIAGCALYLAAPTSDWVHGSIYLVDGGYESW
jgi:2-deoxy-D-gluconate 3-dehydrogenase